METSLNSRSAVSTRCWICRLREQSVGPPAGARDLDLAGSYRNMRTVRAGADLFTQGESCQEVYSLHHGWIFTYLILEDGRRQILSFGLRSGFYGLFPQRVAAMPYGCQALGDATVCAVPRKHLLRWIQQKPELGLQLAWLGKRDEMLLYEHLTSIGRRSARERVAYLLLELFCRAQQRLPEGRGEAIDLPLNQAHIADAMGLTSIHVSRTLKGLREDGILQLRDGVLEILDPDRLLEAAVVDADGAGQWIAETGAGPETEEESWAPSRLPASVDTAGLARNPIRLRPPTGNGQPLVRR